MEQSGKLFSRADIICLIINMHNCINSADKEQEIFESRPSEIEYENYLADHECKIS